MRSDDCKEMSEVGRDANSILTAIQERVRFFL